MKKACLLTGGPGVGKTTIIKQALDRAPISAGGFYTEEIRLGGARQGFMIVTVDGQRAVLAHIDIKGPYRVGRYGVDIEGLERVGVAVIEEAAHECDMVIIDEIGKMELFSPRFQEAVLEAIDSDKRVLGTIMAASHPWADEIKRRPDVMLITVTRSNREQILSEVLRWVKSQ